MKLKSKILLGTFSALALAAVPTTIALASTSCGSSSHSQTIAPNDPNLVYRPAADIKSKFTPANLIQLRNGFLAYYTVGLGDAEILKRDVTVSLEDYQLTINIDVQWRQDQVSPASKSQPGISSAKSVSVYLLKPIENGLYHYASNDYSSDPNTPVQEVREYTLFQLKRELGMWYIVEDRYKPDYQPPQFPEVRYEPSSTIEPKIDYNLLCDLYDGFLKQGLKEILDKNLDKPESTGLMTLNGSELTCSITYSGVDLSNNKQTFKNDYRYELVPNASGLYEYAFQHSPTDANETVTNLTLADLQNKLQAFLNLSYENGLGLN